jgi:hypothetical protein
MASYQNAKKAKDSSKKALAKAEGAAKQAAKDAKAAKDAMVKAQDKCYCDAKLAYLVAWKAANDANDQNDKAYAKAYRMKCVLDGTKLDKCKIPTAPRVTARTLRKEVKNASCQCVDKCKKAGRLAYGFLEAQSMGQKWVEKWICKEAPPTSSKLVPHPDYEVHIGIRLSSKSTVKKSMFDSIYKGTGKKGYKITVISSLDKITSEMDVVYDVMHQAKYTAAEEAALKKFLNTGFRLILVGENDAWNRAGNGYITDIVGRLGGGVKVRKHSSNDNKFTAANKQINDLAVTSGVKSWGTAYWAPLEVDSYVAQGVIGTDVITQKSYPYKGIMVADQILEKGRLTVWADINLFTYANLLKENTPMYKNLAHQAFFFKKAVKEGKDPNQYAKAVKKAEKEGKPPPPKPKTKNGLVVSGPSPPPPKKDNKVAGCKC